MSLYNNYVSADHAECSSKWWSARGNPGVTPMLVRGFFFLFLLEGPSQSTTTSIEGWTLKLIIVW